MRVCDFIIFEIPILTVWSATYMISTVKIGISNIIKPQTLTIFTLFRYFFRIPILLFEINNFLYLLVSLVFSCPLLDSVVAICQRFLVTGDSSTYLPIAKAFKECGAQKLRLQYQKLRYTISSTIHIC